LSAERTLIWLKPQFIGDAVMALPMIDVVCETTRPSVIAGAPVRDVLADRSDNIVFAPGLKVKGLAGLREAVSCLRPEGFERVILVNRSFRSALAARIAGIPIRVGHATEGRGFLLTQRFHYDKDRYEASCYLDLIGYGSRSLVPHIRAKPTQLLPVIGVQPGARYVAKRLAFDTMAEVARHAISLGYGVGLFGGPDEAEQLDVFRGLLLARGIPGVPIMSKEKLGDTMRDVAGLKAMIGNDTGLMHLSAAIGVPTVVAFGPNSPSKWGHPIDTYRAVVGQRGIRSIGSDQLMAALEDLIKQKGPAEAGPNLA